MKQSLVRKPLRAAALLTLTGGLAGAAVIWLTAPDTPANTLVEEFENSKLYRRDLELYGGKMNLLSDELSRWFAGLWHGKTLAFTVAAIAVAAALFLLLLDRHPLRGPEAGSGADR